MGENTEGQSMQAWRVHRYGQPLEVLTLEDAPVPSPAANEVLVEVEAIPLNLNDIERITGGNMMAAPEFPYSPGMEVFGRVVAAGEGAEQWQGQRVAGITRQAHGGYAQFAICPSVNVFAIPDDIALPDAAALLFPFHLAWLGLVNRADLRSGESVLIHAAAGGSGSAAVQLAKAFGATVFATCGSDEKVAFCKSLGADFVYNYETDDWAAGVLEETGNQGVDVVFDNVGPAVMEKSFACTAYNGRYLMMGFASDKTRADEASIVPRRVIMGNIKLCGVLLNYQSDEMVDFMKSAMGWNVAPRALGELAMADILELVHSGAVQAVVGATPSFAELPQAVVDLGQRKTIGRTIVLL